MTTGRQNYCVSAVMLLPAYLAIKPDLVFGSETALRPQGEVYTAPQAIE